MGSPERAAGRRRIAVAAAIAVAAGVAMAGKSCAGRGPADGGARAPGGRGAGAGGEAWSAGIGPPPAAEERPSLDLPFPSPSAGWEEPAEIVTADLRRILDGRPRAGAYEEARAEAARQDLALFPPPRDRLRRLLLGSERERALALAALAGRPDLDDDLVRIVLRSQRPEDDDVVRLLGAEIAAGLEAGLAARHEEDLLHVFEAEPNPLVLAVALPALERMDEARLRRLLRAQAAAASPEMLPILFALARGRLAPGAVEDLEASLAAALGAGE
jgi:hypothetical protein